MACPRRSTSFWRWLTPASTACQSSSRRSSTWSGHGRRPPMEWYCRDWWMRPWRGPAGGPRRRAAGALFCPRRRRGGHGDRAMETPAALGRVFNVGSDQPVTILDLARVAAAVDPAPGDSPLVSYLEAYGDGLRGLSAPGTRPGAAAAGDRLFAPLRPGADHRGIHCLEAGELTPPGRCIEFLWGVPMKFVPLLACPAVRSGRQASTAGQAGHRPKVGLWHPSPHHRKPQPCFCRTF